MILRISKKECSAEKLEAIMNSFEIVRDDDKILTIAGDFDELNPIMSGETTPKAIYEEDFSEFKSESEKLRFTNDLILLTREMILNNLLLIASKGVWTEEARELYNYLNK